MKSKTLLELFKNGKKGINLNTDSIGLSKLIYETRLEITKPILIICSTEKIALDVKNDLNFFNIDSIYLPSFDIKPYSGLYPNVSTIHQRMHVIYESKNNKVFVASSEALIQKTIPKEMLEAHTITFSINSKMNSIGAGFENMGYFSAPMVEHVGQYAKRGCILDVFSPNYRYPIRVELFDDKIESIRFFDNKTQKSINKIDRVDIIPCREIVITDETRSRANHEFQKDISQRSITRHEATGVLNSILMGRYFLGIDYLISYYYHGAKNTTEYFKDAFVITLNLDEIVKEQERFFDFLSERKLKNSQRLILPKIDMLYEPLKSTQLPDTTQNINFRSNFNSDIETQIMKNKTHKVVISSNSKLNSDRFLTKFKNLNPKISDKFNENLGFQIVQNSISKNVELIDEKFLFLKIEQEEFLKEPVGDSKNALDFIDEDRSWLLDINEDSKIVHIDHGIGLYRGLKTINLQGIENEFLEIVYKNNDRLYIPIFNLSKVQRYTGGGDVSRLGGSGWQTTKLKVKNRLRDISEHLITLYARRKKVVRKPFDSPDEIFKQFEQDFEYEETSDQIRAINDVLSDLQKETPMDRLICGDVGFGKTEVAMRAIFYCVQNNHQCIFLVPTTILCLQHYNTLVKRFKQYPIVIKTLSRFTKPNIQKNILDGLKNGSIDVVVATHKILNKNINLKNIGLVVIDEEQKFGVLQKEKIRNFKNDANILSISATPIPRTLNMSLIGLRDLSIIKTPPKNRLPINTFVIEQDKTVIREAILSEIKRSGKVLYVYNRISSIYEKKSWLEKLVPEVKIRVAHGRMLESELEEVAVDFYSHNFDVLLCTTIIESGLDIPQVNTMFVEKSYLLGLSSLYQLRGRIGRSNVESFCYLIMSDNQELSDQAKERIDLLKEFSKLGDGLQVARQDLEYRGSGNILGDEQAGHIDSIGYELYMELLDEAVSIAKDGSSKSILDPDIYIPVPALIPDKYMPDIKMRLFFYRKLSKAKVIDDIDRLEESIRDQFGTLPQMVLNLLGVMSIRVLCKQIGICDLKCRSKFLVLTFSDDSKIDVDHLVMLVSKQNKYSLNPDNKLKIKLESDTLSSIYEEILVFLR